MTSSVSIRKHAGDEARALLRRLAYQVNRASRSTKAETVHDLRVSIRRFGQCLRIFGQFYPKGRGKEVRKQLKTIMHAAGEVRNRDVTLDLVREAGITRGAKAVAIVARQRAEAGSKLLKALAQWRRRDFSRKWRARLEL